MSYLAGGRTRKLENGCVYCGSLDAKNRSCLVVEIVDIVSFKFASDEAAG